mgnify:FL=1
MSRRLVEVDDDGQSRHEEQEEDRPELLDTSLATEGLPEEAQKTKQQRHTVEDIVALIFLERVGHEILVAQAEDVVVEPIEAR